MTTKEKPALREQSGQERDVAHSSAFVHTQCSAESQHGQIVYNGQGRPVGVICGGWLLKTGLDPARHKLRSPAGWATDAGHLEIPGLLGVRLVTISGETWEAPLSLWRRYGIPLDRRFVAQLLLPARFWAVHRPGVRQLLLFGATP